MPALGSTDRAATAKRAPPATPARPPWNAMSSPDAWAAASRRLRTSPKCGSRTRGWLSTGGEVGGVWAGGDAALGVGAYRETWGSKGLQVYVPLNTPCTFDDTRDFALALGQMLERDHPDLVLTNMNPAMRPGKVF